MFNHIHNSKQENGIQLAFVNSINVSAFPCGTRRAELSNNTYIPYDPEARLNTEANNRKHTGLNGFSQSYVRAFKNGELSLVLDGYLFRINAFADTEAVINALTPDFIGEADKLYANIRIAKVKLFSGFTEYYTEVLRDQTTDVEPRTSIDVFDDKINDYYFSGLSFSISPLTEVEDAITSEKQEATSKVVSLEVLRKVDGEWQLTQEALLPKIEHGEKEDSIKVEAIFADSIEQNGVAVPSLHVAPTADGKYQLQFSFGKK